MSSPQPKTPAPWQPRFTLFTLFLVTAMVAVASAGGYYLMQALKNGLNSRPVFILFTIAAPVLTVVFVSLLYLAIKSIFGRDDEE